MALVKKTVVRETYETYYEDAKNRLANLDAKIDAKVAEYRQSVVEEVKDEKERLEKIIALCTDEIEEEVPDEVQETESEEVAGE